MMRLHIDGSRYLLLGNDDFLFRIISFSSLVCFSVVSARVANFHFITILNF